MKETLLLAPLLLLASCVSSGGFISSLDDLTADVDVEGLIDLEQARVISLNGLAPNESPGSVLRYNELRSPFTAFGVSNVDFDLPKDKDGKAGNQLMPGDDDFEPDSYVLRREIKSGLSVDQLIEIRDQLLQVKLKASELIRAQATEAAARGALAAAKSQDESADTSTLETSLGNASKEVTKVRTKFDKLWEDTSKMIKTPGVMIIRVATKEDISWLGSLGEILGLSGERKEERSGFAILSGLRYEMLYVGTDIAAYTGSAQRVWKLIGDDAPWIFSLYDLWGVLPISMIPIPGQVAFDDLWVVSSSLKAKHVIYAQDQLSSAKIKANLEASYSQLAKLDDTLKALEKVRVEAVIQAVSNLGNLGVLGPTTETVFRPTLRLKAIQAAASSSTPYQPLLDSDEAGTWQTVYQISADMADIQQFIDKHGYRFSLGIGDWFAALKNQ